MEDRGLTPASLAMVSGVAPVTVNRWLDGEFQPRFKNLARIADVLDVSSDYLLGRT
jgi:transcriptional regulator with XRE-family HTH domain